MLNTRKCISLEDISWKVFVDLKKAIRKGVEEWIKEATSDRKTWQFFGPLPLSRKPSENIPGASGGCQYSNKFIKVVYACRTSSIFEVRDFPGLIIKSNHSYHKGDFFEREVSILHEIHAHGACPEVIEIVRKCKARATRSKKEEQLLDIQFTGKGGKVHVLKAFVMKKMDHSLDWVVHLLRGEIETHPQESGLDQMIVETFSEKRARNEVLKYFELSVQRIVEVLNSKAIIHKDLKLDNFLVEWTVDKDGCRSEGGKLRPLDVVVCDFGVSEILYQQPQKGIKREKLEYSCNNFQMEHSIMKKLKALYL